MSDARFWYGSLDSRITYLGRGRWNIDGRELANDGVVAAIRAQLKLTGPFAPNTRIEVQSGTAWGFLSNNTFPTTVWWHNMSPGDSGMAADLDAGIWACLESLALRPAAAARAPFSAPQLTPAALAADPAAFCDELRRAIEAWLGPDGNLEDASSLDDALIALGHTLTFYDDNGDQFMILGFASGLGVHVYFAAYEPPSVDVRPS